MYMSKRICVFGSSIGHGHNDIEKGGWCDRLKVYYFASAYDVSVYNLSISGAMSRDLVARFAEECDVRRPKIVIISIGMNDSTFDSDMEECRVPLKETKQNIKKLIEISNKNKRQVVIIGLTAVDEKKVVPVPWAENLSYKNIYIKEYDKAIEEIAKDNNIPYCFMFDLLKKEDLDDGLHPNAQGHKKMFERIKDFLIENGVVE